MDSDPDSIGDERVPVAQVLTGLEVHPLAQGETAIEAFVLLGALMVQVDVLRKELRDEWDDG
jgi:hypothetical protein